MPTQRQQPLISKARLQELKQLDEERRYRTPEPGDPVYARELACIEVSKAATLANGGALYPTFAPKPTLFAKLTGHTKDGYPTYLIPRTKTVSWLWQRYRPSPWGISDREVLEAWTKILYGSSVSIDMAKLIDEVTAGNAKAYAAARERKAHTSRQERWQQVAHLISEAVPPYA